MPKLSRGPLIGVTGPASRWSPGRIAACLAVRRAGGQAKPLRPLTATLPDDLQGLVVTGGSDIDPALYLTSGGPWVATDPLRDQFELAALAMAERSNLPVLGICRGAQLLNVAAGGTLHSDITALRRVTSNRPSLLPRKQVTITKNSRLATVADTTVMHVNSLHHQAVKEVGEGLRIVAHDGDTLVQAIEGVNDRYCLGVQWHPEYMPWQSTQLRLFLALVEAARP